ncbi:MAG: glycosyltransferase family 4 protein [Planctomycetes bacterium]|nr:glycosyltransferase family 4 protein [Planctomycetota bacterium]
MGRFAILTREIVSGDAVGNDVLGMHRFLLSQGHEVGLFARDARIAQPRVRPLRDLRRFPRQPSDILIYHHAVGWPPILSLLRQHHCRKVLRYHNVTPEHFFADIDPDAAALCKLGRDQLRPLVQNGCDFYLADSHYNRQELLALGAEPSACWVVPPFHHIDRLQAVEADPTLVSICRDGFTNLLFVGRLTPNKGHPALLEAFAVYHRDLNPHSRLLLVGKEAAQLEAYNQQLRHQIRQLGLEQAVIFTGETSEEALKAYYQAADVFLSTSAHEGFCVPLVEAMAQRVPVVAYGSSAVPETVGRAGLVWESPDPFLLAASIHRLMHDPAVRAALAERGWQRYQECFTTPRIEAAFAEALQAVA